MFIDLSNMNSGFCDRLRQVTFCIAYEKLQNKKIKFINIYKKINSEGPYYISELISIKGCILKNMKRILKLSEWIHLIQRFQLKTV